MAAATVQMTRHSRWFAVSKPGGAFSMAYAPTARAALRRTTPAAPTARRRPAAHRPAAAASTGLPCSSLRCVGVVFGPVFAMLISQSLGPYLDEPAAIAVERRGLAAEVLPAHHRNIDVGRVEAQPASAWRPQVSAAIIGVPLPQKGSVHRLASAAVVERRPQHRLDRLLRRVAGAPVVDVALRAMDVGDVPDGRLLAVACQCPVALTPASSRQRGS